MNQNRRDLEKRIMLSHAIPLKTPLSIYLDPSSACNFKCKFCYQGIRDKELSQLGFVPRTMDFNLFKEIVSQISGFPDKIKCIGLTGIGEPLLNKHLPKMISYLKQYNVAEKITVTTNASLLTPVLSDALVEAGLDEMIVSVEAMNAKKYLKITKSELDFDKFIENIRYLYNKRSGCKLYIKIANIAFDEEESEDKFHRIFDNISDMAYVEHIIPLFKHVNYGDIETSYNKTLYGAEVSSIEVCSKVFYVMQISATGNVFPCCVDFNETVIFGNVKTENLYNIWNGVDFNNFRKKHLRKQRRNIELCSGCNYFRYNVRNEDILNGEADRLINLN